MKIISVIIFTLISCLFISCNNSEKRGTTSETKIYNFQQQGWKSKQITQFIHDINYTATEVPLQYYILKNSGEENLEKVDSIYNLNSKERIIEIEFQHSSQLDLLQEEFTKRTYD